MLKPPGDILSPLGNIFYMFFSVLLIIRYLDVHVVLVAIVTTDIIDGSGVLMLFGFVLGSNQDGP